MERVPTPARAQAPKVAFGGLAFSVCGQDGDSQLHEGLGSQGGSALEDDLASTRIDECIRSVRWHTSTTYSVTGPQLTPPLAPRCLHPLRRKQEVSGDGLDGVERPMWSPAGSRSRRKKQFSWLSRITFPSIASGRASK